MKGSRFSEEQIIGVLGVPGRFVEFYTLRPVCRGCLLAKNAEITCVSDDFRNHARSKRRHTKTSCPPLFRQGSTNAQTHWKIGRYLVGILP
jgi:hypothetical protein